MCPAEVLAVVTPPFVYDPLAGSVYDSKGNKILGIDGWGMYQGLDDKAGFRLALGRMIVAALNDKYSKESTR